MTDTPTNCPVKGLTAQNGDAEDLVTVRDWLRYGVTAMNRSGVVFGHGTVDAVDEAAFLILAALDLPIESIDPWLDCRLTVPERSTMARLFARRIAERTPAPYLVQRAYIQGRRFYVDERTIVPRSFIGELICCDRLAALVPDPEAVASVLDLCTGSGCLAILAAEAFPNAQVTASDLSADALEVARRNVDDYGLSHRIALRQSDLFADLGPARFDLILSNPPYVTAAAVEAFPPEYQAEPRLAHLGGADGLDLVHRILSAAPNHLASGGALIVEIGQGREALEAQRADLPYLWLDTETSEGEVFALTEEDLASRSPKGRKRTGRNDK